MVSEPKASNETVRARDDRLALAADELANIMNRRWTTLRNVAVVQTVALVVLVIIGWFLFQDVQNTSTITKHSLQAQKAQACSTASTRKFPRFLEDSVELEKLLAYTHRCNELNGVKTPTIKLPES